MRLSVLPLVTAAVIVCPSAHADLSDDYRTLLEAADARQSDAEFLETADLLASVVPGGREEILAAVAELTPRRLGLIETWSTSVAPGELARLTRPAPDGALIPEDDTDPASANPASENDTGVTRPVSHWDGAMDWLHPYHWDGRVKLGLAIDVHGGFGHLRFGRRWSRTLRTSKSSADLGASGSSSFTTVDG